MDFKNSYRVEAVYFQKLKSDIDIAKSYIAAGATDEARAVLENLVDVDGAVLLLYRNIGECWAELANAIEKTKKELDALRDQQEQYHDELNEKIDEINNYIIRLINALDERLTAAEADIDDLQERMLAAESDIDDLEANKQDKLTPGFGIEIDANNEISVDTDDVQEKLIAGQNITLTPDSTDPTKTVIDAAGESYTAGFGIDIDANNEISVDTNDVQEKLIAGQNITLTADSTDPTKTVIDAAGANYNAGYGIEINNNEIGLSKIFPYNSRTQDIFTQETRYTVEHDEGSTIPAYNCRNQGVNIYYANQPISAWITALNNHRNLYIHHRIIPITQETIKDTNKNIELFYQIEINFEARSSSNPSFYLLREVGYRAMSDTAWNAGNQRRELDIQSGSLYLFDFLKLLQAIEDKTLQYSLRIITKGVFKVDGKIPVYNDSDWSLLDNLKNFGVTSYLY